MSVNIRKVVWLGFVFCTNALALYFAYKAFIPWQRGDFDEFMAIAKFGGPLAVVAGASLYYELFGRRGGDG